MKLDLGKLKLIFAKELLFGRPLFAPPPVVDESSAINKQRMVPPANQSGRHADRLGFLKRTHKTGPASIPVFKQMICA